MAQIDRREFMVAAGALVAAPLARAQVASRVYRVGVLIPIGGYRMSPYLKAFAERLAAHGFVEGRNLVIDVRSSLLETYGDQRLTAELLAAHPDALFTLFTEPTGAALSIAKKTPIVFAWIADPVAVGFVASFARPGGNITGVSNRYVELIPKRFELLMEIVPTAKRVAVLGQGPLQLWEQIFAGVRKAAAARGVDLIEARGTLELAITEAMQKGAQGLIPLLSNTFAPAQTEFAIKVAREKRIPAVFIDEEAVEKGALSSLGTNEFEDIRRGADLLAEILRGADPGTLPIDQASRFEIAVNLKTARAMELRMPQSILLRADRVIE
jgi:putative ABC transport system substrate-binding protein